MRVPCVGQGNYGFDAYVNLDYHALVEQGVKVLSENGRRRLAMIGAASDYDEDGAQRSGSTAFRKSLETHSLPYHPEWERGALGPAIVGAGWEMFRDLWVSREEKPDGLLVCDDYLLNDVSMAIHNLRLDVPRDLMIVTHANKGVEYPLPLWKLEFDPDAFAEQLASKLLGLINAAPRVNRHVNLAPLLRKSAYRENLLNNLIMEKQT